MVLRKSTGELGILPRLSIAFFDGRVGWVREWTRTRPSTDDCEERFMVVRKSTGEFSLPLPGQVFLKLISKLFLIRVLSEQVH
jgi:hypothetical protein